MNELFPVVAGLLTGALSAVAGPRRHRAAWAALAAVVIGFVAALVSGELAVSAAFLLFDVGQVLVATLLAHAATRALLARRASA